MFMEHAKFEEVSGNHYLAERGRICGGVALGDEYGCLSDQVIPS
jgi:hypothetical protein